MLSPVQQAKVEDEEFKMLSPVQQLSHLQEFNLQGFKIDWNLDSAFGMNLCAYSALFAALEIDKMAPSWVVGDNPGIVGNITIDIKYSEVYNFAEQLLEQLRNYLLEHPEIPSLLIPLFLDPDSNPPLNSRINELTIGAPLDEVFLRPIAEIMGYRIILEIETPYDSPLHYEFNPGAQKIVRLYLHVNSRFGHYQIITPDNVTIRYINDLQFDWVNNDWFDECVFQSIDKW
ncbi:MAG: hypothetical protein LBR92_02270 [Puniceicoccales bacterium]|jgi:hypothetical protein|nr:hypothetical protein [Puniceicoccales bacterium]